MTLVIAILLWLHALVPGTYTQQQFDQISAANQSAITQIESDPTLLTIVQQQTDPSVVTIERLKVEDE